MDEFLKPNSNLQRLMNEWEKYGGLTIGFDFDGTVHDYHKTGQSHEMVRELLRELKEIGCTLVCWTAYPDLTYTRDFLDNNDIPCDSINEGGIKLPWESKKPFFSALLDDRAGLEQVYRELYIIVKLVKNGSLKKLD